MEEPKISIIGESDQISFIILTIQNKDRFLIPKYENDDIGIFQIDIGKLNNFFASKNMDNNFSPIADIMIPKFKYNEQQKILLVNTKLPI